MWVFTISDFVVGGICTIIGALMLNNKMVEALAGYDPNKVVDKEGLGKWAGSNLLILGIVTIAIGVFSIVLPNLLIYFIVSFIAIMFIITARIAIGSKKYEKR